MMKLTGFRVTNFRSVEDSGWIDVEDITALIGTNESGKTNLLIPLWKLNPAKDGEINPIADYPRKHYNDYRLMTDQDKPVFIEALFEVPDDLMAQLVKLTGATPEEFQTVWVKRNFGGYYFVTFPDASPLRSVARAEVESLVAQALSEIRDLSATGRDEAMKTEIVSAIDRVAAQISSGAEDVDKKELEQIKALLDGVNVEGAGRRSTVAPRFGQLVDAIAEMVIRVSHPHPNQVEAARKLIVANLLSFVYYSNYGNLDSEIYLPHVIQNMGRKDLGNKEEAKARTLKVLFEFVRLQPKEILELGRSTTDDDHQPTAEEIAEGAERTKERDVLLQSASTKLTHKFRDWWKQGTYRFRFGADGDHFRIWVADDLRPEDIELENRSTGLQWFLSFYLIFLVESGEAHKGAMLLLDEPGLSLHPIAQRDLSRFFENLAQTNQIVYTTHSPFLVDPDHLDRVKVVYVNAAGNTEVSANLRAGEKDGSQTQSVYPVYAALGLSMSDTLLEGCQVVIVEGASDQRYLSAAKNYLIRQGVIAPKREIVFLPAGGARGITTAAGVVAAKDEALPFVLLDSDGSGVEAAKSLKSGLYQHARDQIIMIGDITGLPGSEIEDLFPPDLLSKALTRLWPGPDEEFADGYAAGAPILGQIEGYAKRHGIDLQLGWKVELANRAKDRLLKGGGAATVDKSVVAWWTQLFERLAS